MTFRLGIPSKGRLQQACIDWFAARGVTIERAAESDDVETIREKTAARFEAGEQGHAAAEGQFMPVAKRRKNR